MPNAHHPYTETLTFAGRVIPQIAALNAAGKSQADAAAALDTTVCTLRQWLDITGTQWVNLNRRGPYRRQK
jgi:hypothetical protein